jgi:hypothetical protein
MLFSSIPIPTGKLRYTKHMATIDIAHLSLEERLRLLDELGRVFRERPRRDSADQRPARGIGPTAERA